MLNLINLLLTEVIFFIAVFGILAAIYVYKRIFPKNGITDYHEEKEINPFSDVGLNEEIYDTGYLNDIDNFDERINAMKDELNNLPAVEIITDAYEAGLNL